MGAAILNVRQLRRVRRDGSEESLEFQPGVNVLVGPWNSGKSGWLRTLDFLFGDPDPPEKSLGTDIAAAYKAASATLTINGREVTLERRWDAHGVRGKVFLNGVESAPDEFSDDFLVKLGMPVLRIPKGNPYAPHSWIRLSWRMLYRHIYRKEDSWAALAAGQPDSEQFAVLMMFLGAAEAIFPNEYGAMVEKQKELLSLQSRKEQFVTALGDVTRELVSVREARVALTPESINAAVERLQRDIARVEAERTEILRRLRDDALAQAQTQEQEREQAFSQIAQTLAEVREGRNMVSERLVEARTRRTELSRHRLIVSDELSKLERARVASEELADLRVTHCPNCDQRIRRPTRPDRCVLCLQDYPIREDDAAATQDRVDFEIQQLGSEARELDELLGALDAERDADAGSLRNLDDEIRRLEEQLRPVRVAAAWILPPELSGLEQELGRLTEQLRQIERVQSTFGRRDVLAERIDELTKEISLLEAEVTKIAGEVDLSGKSDLLADGINDYLNALNAEESRRWHHGQAEVRLRDRDFRLMLNKRPWKDPLGGTKTCFFLAAYQYALMNLTSEEETRYPGLAVIDLPPNVSDVKLIGSQENYLVEPFINLLARPDMEGSQLIITGHAYEGLQGANRIELTTVYEGPAQELPVDDFNEK